MLMLVGTILVAMAILKVTEPEHKMTEEEIEDDYYSDLRELRTM